MSQWSERVSNHSVWKEFEALGPALDEALRRDGVEPAAVEGIERIRSILAFAGKRLAGVEPHLVHQAPLDGIAGATQGVVSDINAYVAEGDNARIVAANSHADTILHFIAAVNYPFVADDWIALRDGAVAYRNTLEQSSARVHESHAAVEHSTSALQARLTELASLVETESSKLAAVATDFQAQFAKAEEVRSRESAEKIQAAITKLESDSTTFQQRQADLGTEITSERARLTALGSEFQSQFSAAQESRVRDFSETQKSRQDTFSTLLNDYTQKLSEKNAEFSLEKDNAFKQYETDVKELKAGYQDSAKKILDRIEAHKTDVEKLVGVIGNLGVTSGYQKAANHARISMMIWQGVAVVAMIGVIVFAFFAFLPLTAEAQFSWERFAGRVVLAISVGVLAAYAAAQGDKHFEMERRNRKLALELEAIGPYLAPLPTEQQETFRLKLGDRTFGRDEMGVGRKDADRSPATVVDVLMKSKDFRDLIVDAVKTAVKPS